MRRIQRVFRRLEGYSFGVDLSDVCWVHDREAGGRGAGGADNGDDFLVRRWQAATNVQVCVARWGRVRGREWVMCVSCLHVGSYVCCSGSTQQRTGYSLTAATPRPGHDTYNPPGGCMDGGLRVTHATPPDCGAGMGGCGWRQFGQEGYEAREFGVPARVTPIPASPGRARQLC